MVRWLEANGYDVSYTTGVDTDRRGAELLEHKAFLRSATTSTGRAAQRANVEAARDAGVNLAFFSGNEIFWKTRWEPSIDGSGTPYRTLVCYKETHANAKIDPLADVWTGTWRDPPLQPAGRRRPSRERADRHHLHGERRRDVGDRGARRVRPAALLAEHVDRDAAPRADRHAARRHARLRMGRGARRRSRPAGLFPCRSTTRSVPSRCSDYGSTYGPGTATHASRSTATQQRRAGFRRRHGAVELGPRRHASIAAPRSPTSACSRRR